MDAFILIALAVAAWFAGYHVAAAVLLAGGMIYWRLGDILKTLSKLTDEQPDRDGYSHTLAGDVWWIKKILLNEVAAKLAQLTDEQPDRDGYSHSLLNDVWLIRRQVSNLPERLTEMTK